MENSYFTWYSTLPCGCSNEKSENIHALPFFTFAVPPPPFCVVRMVCAVIFLHFLYRNKIYCPYQWLCTIQNGELKGNKAWIRPNRQCTHHGLSSRNIMQTLDLLFLPLTPFALCQETSAILYSISNWYPHTDIHEKRGIFGLLGCFLPHTPIKPCIQMPVFWGFKTLAYLP